MDYKTTSQYLKDIKDRQVTGIFAVHGNVDDGDDRSWPGSFVKTIGDRGSRIRFLWQHDMTAPPIATIVGLRELNRAELPQPILDNTPDAMGGVEVTREYLDTERGNEVLEGIKSGAIGEMSYAYDAVKFDFEEKPNSKYDFEKVRNLREVRLHEVSDVLWGMNPATQGSKTALAADLEWVANYLTFVERLRGTKAGARHSGPDQEKVEQIAALALALGASNIKLNGEGDSSSASNSGKSRDERAEPVSLAINLTQLRADLMKLQLATFS